MACQVIWCNAYDGEPSWKLTKESKKRCHQSGADQTVCSSLWYEMPAMWYMVVYVKCPAVLKSLLLFAPVPKM